MITQQELLYRQLDAHGWRKVEGAEPDQVLLPWWATEVWVLESLWAPQECRVYLTFLAPWEETRGWSVAASLEGPTQWSDVYLNLERPGRRKEGLPKFFASLAELRTEWQKTTDQGFS